MLGKKYLIIDEREEVKSEISDKEREDFLEDEEISDKEALKENLCRKNHYKINKDRFWESSDEDNIYNYCESDDDQSISNINENNKKLIHIQGQRLEILGKTNCNSNFGEILKSILKKTNKILLKDNNSVSQVMKEVVLSKKVNFNLMKNNLNGSFLINFKSMIRIV